MDIGDVFDCLKDIRRIRDLLNAVKNALGVTCLLSKLFKMKILPLACLSMSVFSLVLLGANEVRAEVFLFLDNGTRIVVPDILNNLKVIKPNSELDCLKNRKSGDANLDLWLICNRQTFASDVDLYNQSVRLSQGRYAQERELIFFDVGEFHEQDTPEAIKQYIYNMLPNTSTFHFVHDSNDVFVGCTGIIDNGDGILMYLVARVSGSLVEGFLSIGGGHYAHEDETKYEEIVLNWLVYFRSANQ